MKKLSALMLSAALCFTSVPAFANEVVADDEEVSSVYSIYTEYDGWRYDMYCPSNTVMPVPCSGTITLTYLTRESETIKVKDSSGKTILTLKSSAEDQEAYIEATKTISVTKGTYYLIKEGDGYSYVSAVFNPSEKYTGWQYNGYEFAKSYADFEQNADSEIWYYYKNGKLVTGWQYIGGYWYYFNPVEEKGKGTTTGLSRASYRMVTSCWIDSDDYSKSYYVTENGKMAKSTWVYAKGSGYWFYVNADGTKKTSTWLYSKGKWYWLDDYGCMATDEWIEQDGKWYYLRPSGAMAVNETICGNKFDSHGVWLGKE